MTGTNIDLNGSSYESDDGAITFSGPVDLTVDVSIDSDGNADGVDGNIEFTSTVDGGYVLTLDADTGSVTLTGAAGGTTKLAGLTVAKAGQVDLDSVATSGAISVTGTNIDLNGSSYKSDDGAITFTGPVDLTVDVSIDSDKDDDGTDGDIEFTSTVDATTAGSQSLTLDADTGSVTLTGAAGGTTKLAGLTVTKAGQVDLGSVATSGAISVTGTNIDLNGSSYESDDGAITFSGPVDLTVDVSIDSDGNADGVDGNIEFTSTVDGGYVLTLDADTGSVTLTGAAGGTTKLAGLTVAKAGQVDLDSVKTSGAISVTGTNIDLNGSSYESDDGAITFTGPVDLTVDVSIDSDKDDDGTDGDIEFTSTVDATTAGSQSLTLDADTGSVTLTGAAGGTTKLAGLTVAKAGQVDLDSVKTSGAISVTGTNIDLNGSSYESDDGAITFSGPVDLTVDVSIDSDKDDDGTDGDIEFTSTVDATTAGSQSLTLDADTGSVTLTGAAGGTTKLAGLTVTKAGQVDLGSVAASGAISVTGTNIDLNGSSYESDDGAITFTGPVDLTVDVSIDSDGNGDGTDGNIEFTSTVDGGYVLTLDADTGSVTLTGAVGGSTKLASLTVTKAGQVDLGSVATSGAISVTGTNIDLNGSSYESDDGAITFTGPVDLTVDVSIDSDKDDDGTDGDIEFTSTVDATTGGSQSLTLDADTGSVTLTGAAGGTTKLESLTVTGGQVGLDSVATTGVISVTGTNIDLNGSSYESDDGAITFTGPVDLTVDVSIDSDKDGDGTDGDIEFTSTVDATTAGSQSLTLDADSGAVTLTGVVGGTTKLASLTVTKAGQVDLGSVKTAGAISVTGTNIDLNGSSYESDDGAITFTGPVDLTVDVSINTDGNADGVDGNIEFTSTVDGGYVLTLDADTGSVTLTGAVGGTTKLAGLTVTGGQVGLGAVATSGAISVTGTNIDLNGSSYESDDGAITFTGPVNLMTPDPMTDVRIDSDADNDASDGNILFASTLDGGRNLVLNAGTADITFAGNVGVDTKLGAVTINTAGNVTVGATMEVFSFEQKAGTGKTDFGSGTLEADDFVTVTANEITGRIVAREGTLTAANSINVDVVIDDSLTITAQTATITGTVAGLSGQDAANVIIITDRGSGSFMANGFTILGAGSPLLRFRAELAALSVPRMSRPTLHPPTPGEAVRASLAGAIESPYAINLYETAFPLLAPAPGAEAIYEELPGVIRDFWQHPRGQWKRRSGTAPKSTTVHDEDKRDNSSESDAPTT